MGLKKFIKNITNPKNQQLGNNYNPNSERKVTKALKQSTNQSEQISNQYHQQTVPAQIQYKVKKDVTPPKDKTQYVIDDLVDVSKYERNFSCFSDWKCPYCSYQFEKQVKGKRKCQECKNTIFVRYHYVSKDRILLTEEENARYQKERQDHYDLQWCLQKAQELDANEEDISYMVTSTRRGAKFDILWGLYNKKSVEYASNMQWGLYRNNRLSMGDVLEREGKNEKALTFYLIVGLFDVNGARNASNDPYMNERFPQFSIDSKPFAPGVKKNIHRILSELDLSIEDIENKFKTNASLEHNRLMPLSVDESWEKIQHELTNENE